MLGNWIKCTTATTGTGNLTVAAVSGFPTLSDVFAINLPIAYTVLNASGQPLEAGIGYLSDATTFVRGAIKATYVSGIYNDSNPTAATLAGTSTLICTPIASSLESMMPTVDGTSTVGRFLTSAGRSIPSGTQALTADRLYYVPFLFKCGAPVVSMALSVSTLQAASKARIGLYAVNQNGYVGALIAQTGDLDTTSTGLKIGTLSSPKRLAPGWYVAAIAANLNISVVPHTSSTAQVFGGSPFGFATGGVSAIDYRYEALTSGWTELPANASATTTAVNIGVGNPPAAFVGVA